MGTTRTLNSHWSGTGRSGSENFLHIEETGPGNYLWRWTEECIYAYQPKFSENYSAEWKAPFQITRSYIRVPFTFASSLLSESQEQSTFDWKDSFEISYSRLLAVSSNLLHISHFSTNHLLNTCMVEANQSAPTSSPLWNVHLSVCYHMYISNVYLKFSIYFHLKVVL